MTQHDSVDPAGVPKAAIIAVGSELLTPSRVDTNSLYITEQLNRLGVDVVLKLVVGDDREELARAFRAARARVPLVVFSGGLGPTDDDLTREVVSDVLARPLREDPALTEALRARFLARGFTPPMPENNRRQAMVPQGATVIANANGSAPGLWIEDAGSLTLLLPGPPRELKPMLNALMEGPLGARFAGHALVRRVLRIVGRIESQTDEVLQPLYRRWERDTPPVAATILATLGQIELDLSVRTATAGAADAILDAAAADAKAVIGDDVFTTRGEQLEQVVGNLLAGRDLRIALAESCTGGLIASRLTDVPGSSRYVMEGVIVYSNEAKTARLGVEPDVIARHGAVSEPVARAMATGMRERAGVDIAVGVTGIAGPGGGTPEKPVGTVVIAVATADEVRARSYRFNGDRQQVKFQASQAALDLVRRLLAAP